MNDASDVIGRITLAPDAGLVKSLGANHTLESAIADLVDNSLDAGASRVSIRLLTHADRLAQVEVLDNGKGMSAVTVNAAMTIGHQREYMDQDLGNFGMGLKAASFGHCDVLTVWSSSIGAAPVGRRLRRADLSKDFTAEILCEDVANAQAAKRHAILGSDEGASIIWTEVRNVYRGRSEEEARAWLSTRKGALTSHLGVTFHRLLASGRLAIDILVDDVEEALTERGIPVRPIDPFGYKVSGHPDYPKTLTAEAGDVRVNLTCHIWPSKSDVTGFRIGTAGGEQFQGFYIYRNDRLLQIGGWSDTATQAPSRQLARVLIEEPKAFGPFLTMNPEKSGLRFESSFHDAINKAASSDGTTFLTYLQDAESIFTESNRRKRERRPVIRPEKGIAPSVKKRIGNEVSFLAGAGIDIKWKLMASDEFIDLEHGAKILWINSRYRWMYAPRGGSLNDAPVLKALLYLMTHHVFEGQYLGSRDKDEIALWKSVLRAAAAAEDQMRRE